MRFTSALQPSLVLWTFTVSHSLVYDGTCMTDSTIEHKWFCESDLSEKLNRSKTGAFQSEYLRALAYQPIGGQKGLLPSLFVLPGIEYHCLELSIACGPNLTHQHQDIPEEGMKIQRYGSPVKSRVAQLFFRCGHYIASYQVKYHDKRHPFAIELDQVAHKQNTGRCFAPFSKLYRIMGDGHRYILIDLCLNYVLKRRLYDFSFWLFVNKRNTPEQNREIVQRLAIENPLIRGPLDYQSNGQGECQCYAYERYIRDLLACKQPFMANVLRVAGSSDELNLNKTTLERNRENSSGSEDTQLQWRVLQCLVVTVLLGIVFYTLTVQLDVRHEVTLA